MRGAVKPAAQPILVSDLAPVTTWANGAYDKRMRAHEPIICRGSNTRQGATLCGWSRQMRARTRVPTLPATSRRRISRAHSAGWICRSDACWGGGDLCHQRLGSGVLRQRPRHASKTLIEARTIVGEDVEGR